MKAAVTLWKFSRPHTIIGSVISIFTLYMIMCEKGALQHLDLLLLAVIIGVCCNVFIVGINQVADVDIDKINKPYLPIASGSLSLRDAKIITYGALAVSLLFAWSLSIHLFYIIALAGAIGWAYSMPPFHFKKHHVTAAFSITFVRGVLINVGGFLVFNYLINKTIGLPENVIILTVFIIVFSLVISWFKDLPDMEGDSQYHIKTLAIASSPKAVFIAGTVLVTMTYLMTVILKFPAVVNPDPFVEDVILFYGNLLLMILFLINAFTIDLAKQRSIQKFYKRFWWFFFAEYLVYLVAYCY